jgi:bifunctional DNA-binding transcriptional regulator/antitoxin component of YhaV-PrlF toxin-antitoxin module
MESLIDSDGRILLPAELCRKHGIRPGMKVILTDLGDAILLLPVTTDEAQQIEDEVLLKLGRRRSNTGPLADTGG